MKNLVKSASEILPVKLLTNCPLETAKTVGSDWTFKLYIEW